MVKWDLTRGYPVADLIIAGGTIVDGTGGDAFVGDVAVTDGIVTAVGRVDGHADRRIDAEGCVVTPGFVDIHTHFDGQATWDPMLEPSSLHGVTTVAVGNCGVGFAPAAPDRHDWLISLLEGVEDIPGTALAEGLSWGWESFPEYLDVLGQLPRVVDVAAHVPHSAVRTYVMGERGADNTQQPTAEEIAAMAAIVEEGLAAGAIGFATSRTELHRTSTGELIPTLSAGPDELAGIADAMGRAGRGVIQLISDLYQTNDDGFFDAEVGLLGDLVARSGRPLSFTMQQAAHSPERWRSQMSWIDSMVAAGHDVKAQVAPRPIGLLMGLEVTANPFMLCPTMGPLGALPLEERVARMSNVDVRRAVLDEHAALVSRLDDGILAQITGDVDTFFELSDPVDYELDVSRSLGARARAAGLDPAELVYDTMVGDGGRRLIYLPLFNFAHGNVDVVGEMLASPNILLGLSDAGAHCGAICDGSNPTSSLALWSRDREGDGRVPLERMVHLNTQRNAAHVGWMDRGVVAPGYLADLNVIDLDALGCRPPRVVHDLPAGGRRLVQGSRGYRYTLKSGQVTVENGEHTGLRPGELVRGSRPAPGPS